MVGDPASAIVAHKSVHSESVWRLAAAAIAVVSATVFVGVLGMVLDAPAGQITAGSILLDRASSIYPFTIQNLMWVVFAVGIGETATRFVQGSRELRQLVLGFLPEDQSTMLRAQDLADIYSRVRGDMNETQPILQRMIIRVCTTVPSGAVGGSSELAAQLKPGVAATRDRAQVHRATLPRLGHPHARFHRHGDRYRVGTRRSRRDPGPRSTRPATTLDASPYRPPRPCLQHDAPRVAQQREESALNRSGQYCLDNLINRLYER